MPYNKPYRSRRVKLPVVKSKYPKRKKKVSKMRKFGRFMKKTGKATLIGLDAAAKLAQLSLMFG